MAVCRHVSSRSRRDCSVSRSPRSCGVSDRGHACTRASCPCGATADILACSLLRCRRDLRLCRVRLVFHRWSARPIRCAADCQHQLCALARFSVRTVRRRRAALCRPPACGAHVSFGALQDARNRSITAEVMLRCWAACRCRQARVRAQPHHCAATLAHREYLPPVDAIAKGRGPVGDGRCAPPD